MSDDDGAQGELAQEDEAAEWPSGMSAPHFSEEESSSSDVKPVGDEEANAFLYARSVCGAVIQRSHWLINIYRAFAAQL